MEDISNRTLAIILIAAILISFVGTLFGMTRLTMMTGVRAPKVFVPLINAMTTAVATVNLTVYELTELTWSPIGLNWSMGRVDEGTAGCTISSDGNNGSRTIGTTANNCTEDPFEGQGDTIKDGLNLSNTGNTNVTLNISTSTTATNFIGGTGVSTKWNASDAWGQTAQSTAGAQSICSVARLAYIATANLGNWTAFATTDTRVCNATDKLRPVPRNNTLRIDFEFVIPYDTPAGSKNCTVTATYAKETAAFN